MDMITKMSQSMFKCFTNRQNPHRHTYTVLSIQLLGRLKPTSYQNFLSSSSIFVVFIYLCLDSQLNSSFTLSINPKPINTPG